MNGLRCDSERQTPASSRRGQALAEFALILPLLLAIAGGAMDFARVYQSAITLQSATRNAAEYAASTSATASEAAAAARRVACTETQSIPGFSPGPGGSIAACAEPSVLVTNFSVSATAPGASPVYPLGSATVTTQIGFRTVIPWPWLPDSTWTLTSTQTFSVIQGR